MRTKAAWLVALALVGAAPAPIIGVAPIVALPLATRWAAGYRGAAVALAQPAGPPQGRLFPAFDRFLRGEGDFAFLTREIAEADLSTYRAAHDGMDPAIVPIAGGSPDAFGLVDPVVVIVNRANPLRGVSLRQLDALLSTTRWRGGAAVVRWRDLGVAGALRDRPIAVAGSEAWAGEESARALTVRRHVLDIGTRRGEWRHFPGSGAEDQVVTRVAADPAALGFTGAGHLAPGVRAIAIDGVVPTRTAIAAGRYPLARTIDLLVPRDAHGCVAASTARFAAYLLSDAGQAVVRGEGRFLPLTVGQRRASRRILAGHCVGQRPAG